MCFLYIYIHKAQLGYSNALSIYPSLFYVTPLSSDLCEAVIFLSSFEERSIGYNDWSNAATYG